VSQLYCVALAGLLLTVGGYSGRWVGSANATGDGSPFPVCTSPPAPVPSSAGGLIRLREPGEGSRDALVDRPVPAEYFEAASSSSTDLVEEPGDTEAGGVKVNLSGRFRTSLVLETRPDGSTIQRCLSNLPGGSLGDH
jgi:hypothetical protein